MTFKPKLWLGVGAFALAGSVNPAGAEPATSPEPSVSTTMPVRTGSQNQTGFRPIILAQYRGSGGGEARAEKEGKAARAARADPAAFDQVGMAQNPKCLDLNGKLARG